MQEETRDSMDRNADPERETPSPGLGASMPGPAGGVGRKES